MTQASSRKLTTDTASRIYAKRQRKLRRSISNCTIIDTMSFLSKTYGLLPCFCDHNSAQLKNCDEVSTLSKSSNAFWHRNNKSKIKLMTNNQQQNNSTTFETQETSSSRSRNFQKFRKSIVQRFKRNNKKITARSVINKRTNTNIINNPPVEISIPEQIEVNLPTISEHDSQHSSYNSHQFVSQDNSYDNNEEDENETLAPTISSFTTEQQNINATDNISRTIQETSQTILNNLKSLRKTKRTVATRKKNRSNPTRKIKSSKRKMTNKRKRISKRKIPVKRNKKIISASKRKYSTNAKNSNYRRSPFPNPEIFHSLPQLQNSDVITEENVHKNHLCCKPITSVKDLSASDKKELIEHDYLTLISLLPIYLGSQGDFQEKIREKTNISHDGALELERLMNDWGSTRLFIGANSHYKTLTQKI